MTENVIVYSKENCVQCTATMRTLTQRGIAFKHVDVEKDQEALATLKELGYRQAPVVVAGTEHWSGYRPDMINKLKQSQS
jgi:glutaredoxin-like protein NrdH